MFIQAGVKLRGNLTAIMVLGKQGPSMVYIIFGVKALLEPIFEVSVTSSGCSMQREQEQTAAVVVLQPLLLLNMWERVERQP